MALITCEECGGTVSTKAVACPHCGAPVVIPDELEVAEDTTTQPEPGDGAPIKAVHPVYYDGIEMDASKVLLEMAKPDGNVKHALWDMCDEAEIPEDDKTISGFIYQIYKIFEAEYGYAPKQVELLIPPSEDELLWQQQENQLRREEYARKQAAKRARETGPSVPRCPTCGSTSLTKLGVGSRLIDGFVFGAHSVEGRAQFRCNKCGYMW